MTRIGVVLAIEAGRPGADRATVFARRLGSPITAFDYQMQFLPEGPGRSRGISAPTIFGQSSGGHALMAFPPHPMT